MEKRAESLTLEEQLKKLEHVPQVCKLPFTVRMEILSSFWSGLNATPYTSQPIPRFKALLNISFSVIKGISLQGSTTMIDGKSSC
jgi:hypothetical protein